ncbi:MAG: LemA family protein [Nitrospirae bacterium]|nr:LemA family protein [Nitrospirota bacterium]
MKKIKIIGVIILIITALSSFGFFSVYNKFVKLDEGIKSSWTQIENYLYRISNIVPRYTGIIHAYSNANERQVLKKAGDARIRLTWAKTQKEKIAAANDLLNALAGIQGVIEMHPSIRENSAFIKISDELAIIENSLNIEKKDYNEMVKKYNQKKRQVPYNIVAFIAGFKDFPYFSSLDTGKQDPKIGMEEKITK